MAGKLEVAIDPATRIMAGKLGVVRDLATSIMAGKVGVGRDPATIIMTGKEVAEDCKVNSNMASKETAHNCRMTSMMAGNEWKVSKAMKKYNGDQNEDQWVDTPALLSTESVGINEILGCGQSCDTDWEYCAGSVGATESGDSNVIL